MEIKVFIPNASIIRKENMPNKIGFKFQDVFVDSVAQLLGEAARRNISQLCVKLQLPFRPRSTGYRSQNSRFHGHCKDIADQCVDEAGRLIYSQEEIKEYLKREAVKEGYPTKWSPLDEAVIPIGTSEASVEDMGVLIQVVNRCADEHSFWLTEYDENNVPYKSLAGRTRAEMEVLNAANAEN